MMDEKKKKNTCVGVLTAWPDSDFSDKIFQG